MNADLSLTSNALLFYSRARSASFAIQYWALNQVSTLLGFKTPIAYHDQKLISDIRIELEKLIRDDVERIQSGIYPKMVLTPESPASVLRKIPKVLLDTYLVGKRRTHGFSKEFTPSAQGYLEGLPRYYQRNFHFQSDGYLSERSAEVYDYEVDLLFSGAADAMRRLIIQPMKKHFHSKPEGKGLRFLEIGVGTGRSTQFVKLAFPKAEIVGLDLSEPYLKVAQKNLANLNLISFLRGDGASLPFKESEFDAVYSVFLFHEMPRKIRLNVLQESWRVLKTGGFLGFVDSIQKGDFEQFDPFLEEFPKYFHEPFYIDYIRHPMKDLFRAIPSVGFQSELGFFSKVGYTEKSERAEKTD